MATMITIDCINCGACEPECPNNAISQGDPVYVIDPKLCTECVGFHDYEACAAVCPVDVCVTDPNNIESEEVLIARARALHPETNFGDSFESRFRKGEGKPAAAAPTKASAQAAQPGAATAAPIAATVAGPTTEFTESDVNYIELPTIDSWIVPMRCFKCNQLHVENVKNFMIGNVIFCPHCHKSTVVRDNLNYHVRTLLKDSYEKWQREQADFAGRRERERAEFVDRRAKEAAAFETHQKQELEKIRQQLNAIGENYDAAGKPFKKGSRFGWG
jgi:hypothetical protein